MNSLFWVFINTILFFQSGSRGGLLNIYSGKAKVSYLVCTISWLLYCNINIVKEEDFLQIAWCYLFVCRGFRFDNWHGHLICLKILILACFMVADYSNLPQKASKLIAKRSSQMDGQLFLIKHLLILREQVILCVRLSFMNYLVYFIWFVGNHFLVFQIAPFNIEFSVTQKELDFSHLLVSAS